jgi:hypothetical protein
MKMLSKGSSEISHASRICHSSLVRCITDYGVCAGAHHFVDLWARDSLFATHGLYSKKELLITKTTLETFLRYQRSDGLIPYRILRSKVTFLKYFGIHSYYSHPKPDFRSHQSGGIVPDGGLMTVIAAAEYVRRSGDTVFFNKHNNQLENAMSWYTKRFGNNCISEWFLCEWADSVLKIGKILYTNVLYWRALGDMGENALQQEIGKKLIRGFWNGTYFTDWVDVGRRDYFATLPNMLAIIFGLATKTQAISILQYAKKYCWNGWALEENYPR